MCTRTQKKGAVTQQETDSDLPVSPEVKSLSCIRLLASVDTKDCSLLGSSVHGIFQARVLEWGAIAFSEVKELVLIKYTSTEQIL